MDSTKAINLFIFFTAVATYTYFVTVPVFTKIHQIDNHINTTCVVLDSQYNVYDRKFQLIIEMDDIIYNRSDALIVRYSTFDELEEGKRKYHIGYEFECLYFPDYKEYDVRTIEEMKDHYIPYVILIIMGYTALCGIFAYQSYKNYEQNLTPQNPFETLISDEN